MSNYVYFKISGIGELYLEKILVTFDIPLMFICKDKENTKYTVLCTDSCDEKYSYIIVESKLQDLVDMLRSKITMMEVFKRAIRGKVWKVTTGENTEEDEIEETNIEKISKEDLPEEGAIYEIYDKGIEDYIKELEKKY